MKWDSWYTFNAFIKKSWYLKNFQMSDFKVKNGRDRIPVNSCNSYS